MSFYFPSVTLFFFSLTVVSVSSQCFCLFLCIFHMDGAVKFKYVQTYTCILIWMEAWRLIKLHFVCTQVWTQHLAFSMFVMGMKVCCFATCYHFLETKLIHIRFLTGIFFFSILNIYSVFSVICSTKTDWLKLKRYLVDDFSSFWLNLS